MEILLTGATGSIGSCVLDALVAQNYQVTCIVRDTTKGQFLGNKYPNNCKIINLAFSTRNFDQIKTVGFGFDYIIHTAIDYGEDGYEIEQITVSALLEAAKQTSEQKHCGFIMTSGTLVYGGSDQIITQSSHKHPPEIRKLRVQIEEKVIEFNSESLFTVILRPVWVYGCNTSLDIFIKQCKDRQKILVSNQNSYFSVIHGEDLARAYILMIQNKSRGQFNISEEEPILHNDFYRRLETLGYSTEEYNDPSSFISSYGFFVITPFYSQRVSPAKALSQIGFQSSHNFIEELNSFLTQ